jgi:hypothetical protein
MLGTKLTVKTIVATNLNRSLIVVLSKEPLPWPPLLGLARVSHPSCDLHMILQVTTLTERA